jgi:hypothetical protein
MIGGLKAGQHRDFATVAMFLQQDPRHPVDLIRIARELSKVQTAATRTTNRVRTTGAFNSGCGAWSKWPFT